MIDLAVTINANSVTVAAMIDNARVSKVYVCYDTVGECLDDFLVTCEQTPHGKTDAVDGERE